MPNFRSPGAETYYRLTPLLGAENRRPGSFVNRIFKPLAYFLAAIYFLVDAIFMLVAKPIGDWIARLRLFDGPRNWIASLGPYPTLFLFAVPVIVLEPVKPVAVYLAGTGHFAMGATVFVGGEILKLVLVERLFVMSSHKLMLIPAFAWGYGKYRQAKDWVTSLEAWQTMLRWSRAARTAIRGYALAWRVSLKPRRAFLRSR